MTVDLGLLRRVAGLDGRRRSGDIEKIKRENAVYDPSVSDPRPDTFESYTAFSLFIFSISQLRRRPKSLWEVEQH